MNLNEEIAEMIEGQSGVADAMIMGFDGILVAEAHAGGADARASERVVESSGLLSQYVRLFQEGGAGRVRELLIRTDRYQYLFKPISDEYFLCVVMTLDAVYGKVRFAVERRTDGFLAALT